MFLSVAPDLGQPLDELLALYVPLVQPIPCAMLTPNLPARAAALVLFRKVRVSPNALSALPALTATQLALSAPSVLKAKRVVPELAA